MAKSDSGAKIEVIIQELKSSGRAITYAAIKQRLIELRAPQPGMGCSPNTIYKILDGHQIKRSRLPVARDAVKGPGNPLAPPPTGDSRLNKPNCYYCRYWRVGVEALKSGLDPVPLQCRRFPPRGQERWPRTAPHDWCGEFEDNSPDMAVFHISQLGLFYYAGQCAEPELPKMLAGLVTAAQIRDEGQLTGLLARYAASVLRTIRAGCEILRQHTSAIPAKTLKVIDRALDQADQGYKPAEVPPGH